MLLYKTEYSCVNMFSLLLSIFDLKKKEEIKERNEKLKKGMKNWKKEGTRFFKSQIIKLIALLLERGKISRILQCWKEC